MARVSGLDHQTMLDLAPPEFVTVAAGAGFDAVGLRIAPVSRGEQTWPAGPGSPMLAETMRRCGDTGLVVLDVEAIRLEPGPVGQACSPWLTGAIRSPTASKPAPAATATNSGGARSSMVW